MRALEVEQIDQVTAEAAEQWWRELAARAPIEVSVVGDVDRLKVADLAARYFGALPPRAAIDAATLAGLLAYLEELRASSPESDQAVVAVGFLGPDASATEDVRIMNVVERIIRPQLVRKLRDEMGLVFSLSVTNRPAQALRCAIRPV